MAFDCFKLSDMENISYFLLVSSGYDIISFFMGACLSPHISAMLLCL